MQAMIHTGNQCSQHPGETLRCQSLISKPPATKYRAAGQPGWQVSLGTTIFHPMCRLSVVTDCIPPPPNCRELKVQAHPRVGPQSCSTCTAPGSLIRPSLTDGAGSHVALRFIERGRKPSLEKTERRRESG